jgi:hypothetical protein
MPDDRERAAERMNEVPEREQHKKATISPVKVWATAWIAVVVLAVLAVIILL